VDGLSPQPARDPLMGTAAWSGIGVSQRFPAAERKDPMYNEMPVLPRNGRRSARSGTGWSNLSREYGRPLLTKASRSMAEDGDNFRQEETKKVDIGWTRELWDS